MKLTLTFALGILTGLAFQHIPRRPLFNDTPTTPKDWTPKMRGNWSDEDRDMIANRFFNGGKP